MPFTYKCSECQSALEVKVRGWPSYVCPGDYVLVKTCWSCGWKSAPHRRLGWRPITDSEGDVLRIADTRDDLTTTPYEHRSWCVQRIPTDWWHLAFLGDVYVGNVRIDPNGTLHYAVHPDFRGERLGIGLLRDATALYRQRYPFTTITANVKRDNGASLSCFAALLPHWKEDQYRTFYCEP